MGFGPSLYERRVDFIRTSGILHSNFVETLDQLCMNNASEVSIIGKKISFGRNVKTVYITVNCTILKYLAAQLHVLLTLQLISVTHVGV